MPETRSHISGDNILHVAVVAKRHKPFTVTLWRILLLIALAIPALIGLTDVITRINVLLNPPRAAAASLVVVNMGTDAAGSDNATAASGAGIVPVRIELSSIGVDAHVEDLGLNAAGALQAPRNFTDAGWYAEGVLPGAPGNAVFDGHVNNALTAAGVFEHLAQLRTGDTIRVSDAIGHALIFTVEAIKTYPVDAAPAQEIFSRAGPPGLALITCDGAWNQAQHQFSNRLVVFAALAQ